MSKYWLPWSDLRASALFGSGVLLVLVLIQPTSLYHDEWARLLLQLAILVWVPLGLWLLDGKSKFLKRLIFPAGFTLVIAMQLPVGWMAGLYSVPWLLICCFLFLSGIEKIVKAQIEAADWAFGGAQVLILIGGLSILFDRLGLQPLGFDPAIVLLTAVHFHFAGFIFLIILGLGALYFQEKLLSVAAWMALGAIPLTAIGITLSQVTKIYFIETLAAILMSSAGWLAAIAYFKISWQSGTTYITRLCWTVFAIGLMISMTLSFGYAIRNYFPVAFLNIPEMRAWHGSINALGVAGFGLIGWIIQKRNQATHHKC